METLTVGLLADPGLPEKVARSLPDALTENLGQQTGSGVVWKVEVSRETLPLTPEGEIPLLNHTSRVRDEHSWDYVVYLTDLPLFHQDEPMLCETSGSAGAALVSLPALGGWRTQAKALKLITALVLSPRAGTEDLPSPTTARQALGRTAMHRVSASGKSDISYILLPGPTNQLRLLTGMIHNNRPGRLLPALSACMATAAATGAFGIFYASIWNMSDALHPSRLAFISVMVTIALTSWLVVRNGLWNKVRGADTPRHALRDNISTFITVWLSTALMYVLLWILLFLVALAVIAASYLQTQLGHPVTLLDYGHLSWLAASLGTLSGALGSNFDSEDAIREATYSRREYQRRKLAKINDN